jgi:hypothetical protein
MQICRFFLQSVDHSLLSNVGEDFDLKNFSNTFRHYELYGQSDNSMITTPLSGGSLFGDAGGGGSGTGKNGCSLSSRRFRSSRFRISSMMKAGSILKRVNRDPWYVSSKRTSDSRKLN